MMSIARRKFVTVTAATAVGLALAASGCSQRAGSGGESTASGSSGSAAAGFPQSSFIGVSLPQKTSQNWEDAQSLFPQKLDALGFKNQVQFANGGVSEQQNQINSLITRNAKALIVGPIDSAQLASQLSQAASQNIPVISYDRMITDTKNVDYLVTFQPQEVGKLQGQSLLTGLQASGKPAPYNVELFAGSPDDNNAKIFFESAMKVLQPKIDDGTLVVQSGQTSFQQVATQGWKPETAQARMDAILTANYSSNTLDGVLSPNDTIARGLITSIRNAGKDVPPMTGQDSDPESIKLIHARRAVLHHRQAHRQAGGRLRGDGRGPVQGRDAGDQRRVQQRREEDPHAVPHPGPGDQGQPLRQLPGRPGARTHRLRHQAGPRTVAEQHGTSTEHHPAAGGGLMAAARSGASGPGGAPGRREAPGPGSLCTRSRRPRE